MTQVKLVKLKLKEGNEKVWLDWCDELKQRKDEVMQTLRHEGVVSESCFLSQDDKCIYYSWKQKILIKQKLLLRKVTSKLMQSIKKNVL